jgi:XTP/dITP diphosphohydrolase
VSPRTIANRASAGNRGSNSDNCTATECTKDDGGALRLSLFPDPRPEYDRPVMTLAVATTNPGKLREIYDLLAGLPIELRTLNTFPPVAPPEETGTTFAENALQKALYYVAATGVMTVAEDSGLEIDALGGAPGVQSARFGGDDTPYPEKFALIYKALSDAGVATSPARFVCALAVAQAGRIIFEARGVVEGSIAPEPRGSGGFGYDPIFYYEPFGCTLAEAGDRKASVSHRGQAFRALRAWLEDGNLRADVRDQKSEVRPDL